MTAAAVVVLACLLAFCVTFVVALAHGQGDGHGDGGAAAAEAAGHGKPHGHSNGDRGHGEGHESGDDDDQPASGVPKESITPPPISVQQPGAPAALVPASTVPQGSPVGATPEAGANANVSGGVAALPATGPATASSPSPLIPPAPPVGQIGGVGTPIVAGQASASAPVALEVVFVVVACLVAGIIGSRLLARRPG